jgi:hypothetical protein
MRHSVMVLLLALGACSQQAEQQPELQNEQHAPVTSQQSPVTNELHPPGPREMLQEPRGPIDPTSVEAAGQVVQSYGALIEQKRWAEASALWGSRGSAEKFRAAAFRDPVDIHLGIGNLGEPEGAAGSIYVTMPVVFYGDGKDGVPFRRSAQVVLRRVNDVPGSTEEQRRWHIDRIELDS